jgi:hypothetical protein
VAAAAKITRRLWLLERPSAAGTVARLARLARNQVEAVVAMSTLRQELEHWASAW